MPLGVYKIEVNDKTYVGSSGRSIKQRWKAHLYGLRRGNHPNVHLQNAYNKYGESALSFSVLEVVEVAEEVIILEQKYINEINPEFNICKVAGSTLGNKSRMGQTCPEAEKEKIRAALMGNQHHKGIKHSEETKLKLSQANKGYKHTDEARAKMLASKGSEETRLKMKGNQRHKGCKHSDETKLKMSLSMKMAWEKRNSHPEMG